MEWLNEILEWLNSYSGLLALLAVVAPFVIYYKQKKDQQRDWEDELEGYENNSMFPMNNNDRDYSAHQYFRKKKTKRRRK